MSGKDLGRHLQEDLRRVGIPVEVADQDAARLHLLGLSSGRNAVVLLVTKPSEGPGLATGPIDLIVRPVPIASPEKPCTIRINEVFPVPQAPLIPIVNGGRVSRCRRNAAMARA